MSDKVLLIFEYLCHRKLFDDKCIHLKKLYSHIFPLESSILHDKTEISKENLMFVKSSYQLSKNVPKNPKF